MEHLLRHLGQQYAAPAYVKLDQALDTNPGAHLLLHSDRSSAYTAWTFHNKLVSTGITQSMSRAGRCIDTGSMESFRGLPKWERYYGKRFTSRKQMVHMIQGYIIYYNFRRQRGLGMEAYGCIDAPVCHVATRAKIRGA